MAGASITLDTRVRVCRSGKAAAIVRSSSGGALGGAVQTATRRPRTYRRFGQAGNCVCCFVAGQCSQCEKGASILFRRAGRKCGLVVPQIVDLAIGEVVEDAAGRGSVRKDWGGLNDSVVLESRSRRYSLEGEVVI